MSGFKFQLLSADVIIIFTTDQSEALVKSHSLFSLFLFPFSFPLSCSFVLHFFHFCFYMRSIWDLYKMPLPQVWIKAEARVKSWQDFSSACGSTATQMAATVTPGANWILQACFKPFCEWWVIYSWPRFFPQNCFMPKLFLWFCFVEYKV